MNASSYRKWAYLSTILTGFAALCAQVIWQRYLAILVGSEARSITLVIAIFLSGLAIGYYVFGFITERKKWSRNVLLKLYGYIELLTALYIIFFCIYFEFLKALSFNSPPYFIIDILISLLALFLPTFLMGASIPILTTTLPDNSKEVNSLHASIYGWNTLGACFGTLISGFYLLPFFGLSTSLILAGVINLFASLIFIKNPLKGNVYKQDKLPTIPSVLPNSFYIFFTFLTGAIVISFEVFFVRILHLSTQGARIYNFPLILAVFIGGLAIGSLSLTNKKISVNYLIQQLFSTIILMVFLFWIIPYWPEWFFTLKSTIGFNAFDYIVFQSILFLLILILLFPAVFCMGQLLPLAYTLMKKDVKNYGHICGALYFSNTIGTVFGAVGIGYLALYVLNIDSLFKINIYVLSVLALTIALFEKNIKYIIALSITTLIFAFLPIGWGKINNYPHYVSDKSDISIYKKLFFFERSDSNERIIYFNDGPNTTVEINQYSMKKSDLKSFLDPLLPNIFKEGTSYSVLTNGKSDSNTRGDFSTLFLIPILPWLFAPSNTDGLSSAVVGLGTGVSAGMLGKLEDVREIDVLEISSKVIEGIRLTPAHLNFEVMNNQKINFIEVDAFKYFTKIRKKFDIIVSEPSNVWVPGVENLFSMEFYQLASRSLTENGVLGQWIQNYSIDEKTIVMVLNTIKTVFPYTELYKIGDIDILILASQKPLNHDFSEKRIFNPFLHKFFKSIGINSKEDIYLFQILNNNQYRQLTSFTSKENKDIHSLTKPKLSYRADKARFMSYNTNLFELKPAFIRDKNKTLTRKMKVFQKYKEWSPESWRKRCSNVNGFYFLCEYMKKVIEAYSTFENTNKNYPIKLNRYSFLRRQGLIKHNNAFLDDFFSKTLKKKYIHSDTPMIYVNERMSQGDHWIAHEHITIFKNKKIISEKEYESLKNHIDNIMNKMEAYLN